MIFLPLHSKSLMEGSTGIFDFSVLAILRSIFQVLHWKTLVNYSFTVHNCCLRFYGFSALVFSFWQNSFKWFFGFGVRYGFLFFYVLSVTSHSADHTVMIHVLIFSMKTDVILYSTCSTHHQQKTFDGFVFSFWLWSKSIAGLGFGWFFSSFSVSI